MPFSRKSALGFTLIEIAIVLFIGGMLLAGAMQLASALVDNAHQKATRESMQAIKVAVQNFVGRTGRLPCPAVYTNGETDPNFGVEAPLTASTATTCTGTVSVAGDTAKLGTLPWKTLGLTAASAMDGWNNQFTFAITTSGTFTTMSTVGGMRGVLTVHSTAPIQNGLPATGNQINACSTTAGDNSCNLFAALIIISHGKNGEGAYSRAGTQVPLPDSTVLRELKNTILTAAATPKSDVAFVNADYSTATTATYFDDLVVAMSPAEVLAPLLAQGGVKYESALLEERFRQLTFTLAIEAVNNRSGSSGSFAYAFPSETSTFSYSLDSTKFDTNCTYNPPTTIGFPISNKMQSLLDPWGTRFYYRRGDNAIEFSESCPTVAVFVSAGPDKNIATTSDNIHYYVSISELRSILGTTIAW